MRTLEIIQTLHTSNEKLPERINTIENDNHNLMRKIHSMTMGNETLQTATKRLFGRSYTVEIDN